MALNLKNPEVERLAQELALLSGTSKTEAIRQALIEKRDRMQLGVRRNRKDAALQFLRERVWPTVPPEARRTLSREEEDAILGYGPDGVPS